ncbi:MAG: mandelate racemase/muconate lactonizing enzyme family protein [Pseudomonadota bacterium]
MRLAHSSLHVVRLPYERPVRWSDIVEDGAQFLLLRLDADSGHTGVAEMTLKPTWTGASQRSLIAALEDVFLPLLQTLELSDVEAVRSSLDGIPENHAAKALIDNALWDLHAAAAGKPLWQTWGGAETVPVSFTVTRQAPALMAAEAALMAERYGFTTLKIKGGQGIDVDVAAMRELRAAVGNTSRMYVDANGAYALADAARYVQAMADAGAEVVEDPCALAPDAAFRQLQQSAPTPVLVDFGCGSRRDARLFIDAGARALSLKPGRFGLSDTRFMSTLAQQAGCKTVVGMFGESMLGTLAALQLSATLPPASLPAEVTWFLAMTEQIVSTPIEIQDGMIRLPAVAGSAALIDWNRVARLTP